MSACLKSETKTVERYGGRTLVITMRNLNKIIIDILDRKYERSRKPASVFLSQNYCIDIQSLQFILTIIQSNVQL